MMLSLVAFLLVGTLSCIACGASLRHRSLTKVLSTTKCNSFREEGFQARLELYYFYLLEFANGTAMNLPDIDRAVATAVINVLRECDDFGRPKYAVELSETGHQFSQGEGVCSPNTDGAICRVVRGKTSVLLDENFVEMETTAYFLIERALKDVEFLQEFTAMRLLRSSFIRSIGENLVLLAPVPENDSLGSENVSAASSSNETIKIAVAVGFLSFALATVCFYGIYRYQNAEHKRTSVKSRVAHFSARRRQYFSELDEGGRAVVGGWMTTDPGDDPVQSITWSVSDLTSDSQSIRSSLPMDRIEEEIEVGSNISHSPLRDGRPVNGKSSSSLKEHIDFIAHWKSSMDSIDSDMAKPKSPIKDLAAITSEDDDDVTPVRRNGLVEYDAVDVQELIGCHYLDDSVDSDLDLEGQALDASTNTLPMSEFEICASSVPGSAADLSFSEDEEDDLLFVGVTHSQDENKEPNALLGNGARTLYPVDVIPAECCLAMADSIHANADTVDEATVLSKQSEAEDEADTAAETKRELQAGELAVGMWLLGLLNQLQRAHTQKRLTY